MRTLSYLLFVSVVAGLAGCQTAPSGGSSSAQVLDPSLAALAGLSAQETSLGADLYAAKCGRCHKFYNPTGYSDDEWRTWMRKMSRKSRLQDAETAQLSHYLGAFRLERPAGGEGGKPTSDPIP